MVLSRFGLFITVLWLLLEIHSVNKLVKRYEIMINLEEKKIVAKRQLFLTPG
jgi:hypothetical protein